MTARQCLSCSVCCEGWLNAKINDQQVSPYKPCKFCTGKGCGIYENRPVDPCVNFKCGWLMNESPLPEHMKPNECGAIIMFDRKWHGAEVTIALPVGTRIPDATLEWLMAYSREHLRPLIYCENLWENDKFNGTKQLGYGPPLFVEAVKNSVKLEDIFMR